MGHRFWNMVCGFILSLPGVLSLYQIRVLMTYASEVAMAVMRDWAGQSSCQATIAWLTQDPERPRQTGAALM